MVTQSGQTFDSTFKLAFASTSAEVKRATRSGSKAA
jgi:hypothetical protein